MIAYTEVVHHLEQLDLSLIKPKIPLASGIIDLLSSEDIFTSLLSLKTKKILTHHTFHNDKFPEQINMMMDDFVSTYKLNLLFLSKILKQISLYIIYF